MVNFGSNNSTYIKNDELRKTEFEKVYANMLIKLRQKIQMQKFLNIRYNKMKIWELFESIQQTISLVIIKILILYG